MDISEQSVKAGSPDQERAKKIQAWVERIRDEGLPSFTHTIQQITEIATDEEADLQALSELIKKDAGMSARILKASNAAYRTRRGRVDTISRAVVMLGVQEVKKICLTCSLLDGLLDGDPDSALLEEMTRTFYAASQTRLFAMSRGDLHSEEVFLSALMNEIGPLAFWRLAGDLAAKIRADMDDRGCTPEESEEKILGFTLVELSEALANEWKLNAFIPSEKSEKKNEQDRAREIRLSSQLTRNLRQGWNSPNVECVLKEIEADLMVQDEELKMIITTSLQETIETAIQFGVPVTDEYLPMPPDQYARAEALNRALEEVQEKSSADDFEALEPDPMLQLEILRDLTTAMMEKRDITLIVVRILEGIYRGIGLDRVVFSLLSDRRDELSARIVFGADQALLRSNFVFELEAGNSPIFADVIEHGNPIWRYHEPVDQLGGMLTDDFLEVIEDGDFFFAPVIVDGKWLGAFYADRRKSMRELDQESFEIFKQLTFQAQLAFKLYEDSHD